MDKVGHIFLSERKPANLKDDENYKICRKRIEQWFPPWGPRTPYGAVIKHLGIRDYHDEFLGKHEKRSLYFHFSL